jgi:hypothetical protein
MDFKMYTISCGTGPAPSHTVNVELSDGTRISIQSQDLQKFLDLQTAIAEVEAAYVEADE